MRKWRSILPVSAGRNCPHTALGNTASDGNRSILGGWELVAAASALRTRDERAVAACKPAASGHALAVGERCDAGERDYRRGRADERRRCAAVLCDSRPNRVLEVTAS